MERIHYNSLYIGGVRVDNVSMKESVELIEQYTKQEKLSIVTTPNMDFLFNASQNVKFREVLNSSTLNIPDGMPLILISKMRPESLKEKVSGANLFINLCEMASKQDKKIYLLGSAPGVALRAKEKLESRFPGLNIVGFRSPSFGFENNEVESSEILKEINHLNPEILFVGVGSPKQEMWISKYRLKLNVKVAIGVGASIDFAAEVVKIPPDYIKKIGLAWLWRLLFNPKRLWKRYIHNNLPFFLKLVFQEIKSRN